MPSGPNLPRAGRPEDRRVLSEEDIRILKDLIGDAKKRRRNTEQRPAVDTAYAPSTEVYIAFVPEGGIPALSTGSDSGTGTLDRPSGTGIDPAGIADDSPGLADGCAVFRILPNPDDGSAPALVSVGLHLQVYNLSTVAVPPWTWVVVQRDKWGSWLVVALPSSGGFTGVKEVVTGVACGGDGSLTVTTEFWTFVNGDFISSTS